MTSAFTKYTISSTADPSLKLGLDTSLNVMAIEVFDDPLTACTWQLVPTGQTTPETYYLFHTASKTYLTWDTDTKTVSTTISSANTDWILDPSNKANQPIKVAGDGQTGDGHLVLNMILSAPNQNSSLSLATLVDNNANELWQVHRMIKQS